MTHLIGSEYEKASLSKVRIAEKECVALKKFLENPCAMLIIQGGTGSGKTYFCGAVLNESWNKPYECRFYTCRGLINEVKDYSAEFSGAFENKMRTICQSRKIILDDLGFNLNTDWQKDILNLFVDERSANLNSTGTIITTNLSEEEIREMYGYRFHSRLFDARNLIIAFNGADLRLEGI